MADGQRIYPVRDPESSPTPQAPTVPLVPRGSSRSDKYQGDPSAYPPFHRTIPVTYAKPPRRRSCFGKCMCWTISLLLLQIIVLAIMGGLLFLIFRPKLPKFSVDDIQMTNSNLANDGTLSTAFDVGITARNPNKKIGIYYEGGSKLTVWYLSTQLCQGSLPKFYQGHRNTTLLNVGLTGQTPNAAPLLTSLQAQQQTGSIPITLRVNQPVRIKLGKLKLPKMKFRVRCRLIVDSLAANNQISIKSSTCKFRFRL